MTQHTEQVLEFDVVRDELVAFCRSFEAAAVLRNAGFFTEATELAHHLEIVGEAERRLRAASDPRGHFPDIEEALQLLAVEGSVLDEPDIADVASYILAAGSLVHELRNEDADCPKFRLLINELLGEVEVPVRAASNIRKHFDPAGHFDPDTVPELKELATSLRRLQSDISRSASVLMRDTSTQEMWTSDQPTQRDGRTVLPLNADHRGRLQGIVHELSATGRTVFIEPPELLTLNNERMEAESRLRHAINAKLREFCVVLRGLLPELAPVRKAVAELDLLFAKGEYSVRHNCIIPEVSPDKELRLIGARHPMLGSDAVPIRVEIESDTRALIVSGPNTGGKTVTLKTIGIVVLMHQFGLPVPADPGTSLPVFRSVGADIGDEQSISASLSTFSGHIRAISDILNEAGSHSLVLLDELGAGTDPEDGASLATALLEHFIELGALCILTTHLGALKSLAFTQSAVRNASMEYDQAALAPTFRVVPGVPGSSHALEIAARSGLPGDIVRRAESIRREGRTELDHVIADVLSLREKTRKEAELAERERIRYHSLSTALEGRERELERRELELRKGRVAELEEFAAESRRRLEQLVRELREAEITKEKTQEARRFAAETQDRIDQEKKTHHQQNEELLKYERSNQISVGREPTTTSTLTPGLQVRLLPEGKQGVLVRKNRDGSWIVSVGALRLNYSAEQLQPLNQRERNSTVERAGGVPAYEYNSSAPSSLRASTEIDLRGKTLNEAISELERQLDACLVAGLASFSVIHGVGEGVLQKGIRAYLRERPEIEDLAYARPEHGGFGKSIVSLQNK